MLPSTHVVRESERHCVRRVRQTLGAWFRELGVLLSVLGIDDESSSLVTQLDNRVLERRHAQCHSLPEAFIANDITFAKVISRVLCLND